MQSAKKQLNKSAGQIGGMGDTISSVAPSDENVPPSDDNTAVMQRLAVFAQRDGAITVARLIDRYMAQYAGRDSSRPQRLRFWTAQLGDVALRDLSDDNVFHALEGLKATRPRYFA